MILKGTSMIHKPIVGTELKALNEWIEFQSALLEVDKYKFLPQRGHIVMSLVGKPYMFIGYDRIGILNDSNPNLSYNDHRTLIANGHNILIIPMPKVGIVMYMKSARPTH